MDERSIEAEERSRIMLFDTLSGKARVLQDCPRSELPATLSLTARDDGSFVLTGWREPQGDWIAWRFQLVAESDVTFTGRFSAAGEYVGEPINSDAGLVVPFVDGGEHYMFTLSDDLFGAGAAPACGGAPVGTAVVAENSVTAGDVVVTRASPGPVLADAAEAVVGIGAKLTGSLTANRVKVKMKGTVNGDVAYNELDNNGSIQGKLLSPLALPVPMLLPPFPSLAAGNQNVTLKGKQDLTLASGVYAVVKLKAGTKGDPTILTLSGGTYQLAELDLGEHSRVECAAACTIQIAGRLLPGPSAYLGPASGSGLGPGDVEVFVAGINGQSGKLGGTPKAATVGIDNEVKARIFVPNGTLWIKEGSVATGRFVGRDVEIGIGTQVSGDGA
ncbi:MAG: hypothetical protein HY744_09835 [Deltaproteobacteria bacterium]|nr:hypothetical protein [Deltaproteobacteria bacterium]